MHYLSSILDFQWKKVYILISFEEEKNNFNFYKYNSHSILDKFQVTESFSICVCQIAGWFFKQ